MRRWPGVVNGSAYFRDVEHLITGDVEEVGHGRSGGSYHHSILITCDSSQQTLRVEGGPVNRTVEKQQRYHETIQYKHNLQLGSPELSCTEVAKDDSVAEGVDDVSVEAPHLENA